MPSYIPLPDVANALRQHRHASGYDLENIHYGLQALSDLASMIYHAQAHPSYSPPLNAVRQTWQSVAIGDPNFPLVTLDFDQLCATITENLHRMDDPGEIIIEGDWLFHSHITKGMEWFARCVSLHEVDPDGSLGKALAAMSEDLPSYHPTQTLEEHLFWQTNVASSFNTIDAAHPLGPFPSLTQALQRFVDIHDSSNTDSEAIYHILRHFQRVGMYVADTYIEYSNTLEVHDAYDTNHFVQLALPQIKHHFANRVKFWADAAPLRVRRVLAESHITGDFMFLWQTARVGWTPERSTRLGWIINQWIIKAATRPDVDCTGRITNVVMEKILPTETGIQNYRPIDMIPEIVWNITPDDDAADLYDVPTEAYGPLNDVANVTMPVPHPEVGEVCPVCRLGLAEGDDPCVKVIACGHQYHSGCIQEWLNAAHTTAFVTCPYCRARICPARTVRAILSEEESEEEPEEESDIWDVD